MKKWWGPFHTPRVEFFFTRRVLGSTRYCTTRGYDIWWAPRDDVEQLGFFFWRNSWESKQYLNSRAAALAAALMRTGMGLSHPRPRSRGSFDCHPRLRAPHVLLPVANCRRHRTRHCLLLQRYLDVGVKFLNHIISKRILVFILLLFCQQTEPSRSLSRPRNSYINRRKIEK